MKNAQRLAFATCAATLVLITVGAIVRATGSGLGCPDWPLCHGQAVPPGQREAMIEFSHRFVASIVGFMVIGVAFMAWRHYRHVPFVFWAALITVPLVGLQGVLGAITVVRELPPEIVATHLITAMLVLTFQLAVAIGMVLEDPERRDRFTESARRTVRPIGLLATAGILWLAALIWIGGYMAESGASTACADWPTCNGLAVFPSADEQEVVHMVHRYLAAGFIAFVAPLLVMTWRRRRSLEWAAPLAVVLATLYVAQVVVGALNVWFVFPDTLTVSHTAIAAGIWFVLSATMLMSFYSPAPERVVSYRTGAKVPA